MTISKENITTILEELPDEVSFDEIEKESKKEIKQSPITKNIFQRSQNEKSIKKWEEWMSYHLLNPKKFAFGLKDL